MKKLLFLLVFVMGLAAWNGASAQANYKNSIGLRLGWAYGVSYKHFFTDKMALEAIVSSRYYGNKNWGQTKKWGFHSGRGANITALLEWHFPIGRVEGFNWFVGGGLHLGYWRGGHYYYDDPSRGYFMLGLDAIGGVEYTFSKIPLTLQADIKPTFNFVFGGRFHPGFDEIAITARYVIGR